MAFMVVALTGSLPGEGARPQTAVSTGVQIDETFGSMPLYFIANQGQADERVAYYVQGADASLYFTSDGVTIVMSRALEAEGEGGAPGSGVQRSLDLPAGMQRWVLKLDFVGASPLVRMEGEDRSQAVVSYFKGRPQEWHAGVPVFTRLVYHDLWEGIDLAFSGKGEHLKYEFILQPGVDPGQVHLA